MRRMMEQQVDEFYYITMMNENYAQPSMPDGVESDIIQGMYRYATHTPAQQICQLRLLGSGAILLEVIAAAELLARDWNVGSEVFSVTSFAELAREAAALERWNRLHPLEPARTSHLERQLAGMRPVIAATDYVRAYPQLIAPYVAGRFVALGTDGFGRSDNRPALRSFFEVDRHSIVVATLATLSRLGELPNQSVSQAIERYGIDAEAAAPWQR
jgi:pyruvate dehydrogenase E1 component